MARPVFATPALAALALAALVATAPTAHSAAPAGAPVMPEMQRQLLAGGIDSLGRAHMAAPASAAASLTPLSTVLADVPQAALDARLKGDVVVRVRVSRLGLVDSARVVSGDARLRAPALAAARWYLYAAQPRPEWTTVTITIDGTVDSEPLALDVIGMARDAERAGHFQAALDAWAGVLNRCGTHPTIRNPWAIREHIAEVQRRMPVEPPLRGESQGYAVAARIEQQRTVARAAHADLVKKFEDAQRDLPWWDEPYQWDAASLIGAGRSQDAIRTIVIFRAATRDTASYRRANRALAGIAAGDTVMVGEMLKQEGRKFETPE